MLRSKTLRHDNGKLPVLFVRISLTVQMCIDGVESGSTIANLFKDKYKRLFNSMKICQYFYFSII